MAALDAKAYEEAVVKPLKRRSAGALPDDLVTRYAVELTMADADVVRRLAEVRSHWNKGANAQNKPASVRSVYKAFLRADEALRKQHGSALERVDWWREHDRSRAGERQGRITELTQTLRSAFGDLGVVAQSHLKALLDAEFAVLAPDEVDRALKQAGVRAASPVELPRVSGVPDTQYRELERQLVDADTLSVPELIHGELTSFTLLTDFTSEPSHPGGLTTRAVTDAVGRENKRSGNQAARQALNILLTAAKAGVDLRALALFHLLEEVRANHRQGVPPVALLKRLAAKGLDRNEAQLAVLSVLNTSASAPATGLTAVKALLEQGKLIAAQQTLATVAGGEDAAAARMLVDQQLAQVRTLRAAAHTALNTGDEDEARHQLRQAAALATDDDEIVAELNRIPLPPPLGLSAQPDGVGVRVSWRRAASHDTETRYRLVRKEGRAPADPDDGVRVHEGPATVTTDAKAPAARPVGYAVFAAADGGSWSRSVTTTVEALPSVHNVQISVENDTVSGRWQVHPDAVAVEVTRGDGAAVAKAGRSAFTDRATDDATYTITACYRRADGTAVRAPAVSARATTSGRALPLTALRLTAAAGSRIAVGWRHDDPDAEVVVRRAEDACPWEFGEVVSSADLAGYGVEVTGVLTADGDWRTLVADVPTGLFWYVPFTLSPSGAVRGQDGRLGIALPLTGLRHQRLGDERVFSWVWPEAAGIAEVRWETPDDSGRVRLTRQQYQDAGGCRIRCGPGELRVRARSVVAASGGECVSADAELVVPARRPRLRYTVQHARRPLLGGGTVLVRLTAEDSLPRCTVLVVAAHGTVMPRRPGDGQVLLRSPQDLAADGEVELSAELPRLRKPYWIRCFLEEEGVVLLVDPPTKQLKVS